MFAAAASPLDVLEHIVDAVMLSAAENKERGAGGVIPAHVCLQVGAAAAE